MVSQEAVEGVSKAVECELGELARALALFFLWVDSSFSHDLSEALTKPRFASCSLLGKHGAEIGIRVIREAIDSR